MENSCAWITTLTPGCGPHVETQRAIKAASIGVSFLAALAVLLYLRVRLRKTVVSLKSIGAIELTVVMYIVALFLRGIDAAMVVFQVYPDTTTAWAVLQIGWMLKYHGDVYFIYSLAHSVPNAYMDNKGSVQSTLLPPRWMFVTFCAVQYIGNPLHTFILGALTGYYNDIGGPVYTAYFVCWFVELVTLLGVLFYYASRLTQVIRHNFESMSTASRGPNNGNMDRAVRRIKVFLFIMAPMWSLYAVFVLIMAVSGQYAYTIYPYAIIMQVFYDLGLGVAIFSVASSLLVLELLGIFDIANWGLFSSSHSNNHRSVLSYEKHTTDRHQEPSVILQEAVRSLQAIEEKHLPLSLSILERDEVESDHHPTEA